MTMLEAWSRASENIETRAKDLTFRQVALTLVAALPFLIFFVVYFAWRVLWTAITWLWSAGIEGWETAKKINGR